jgi:hypothetical protein
MLQQLRIIKSQYIINMAKLYDIFYEKLYLFYPNSYFIIDDKFNLNINLDQECHGGNFYLIVRNLYYLDLIKHCKNMRA